MRSKSFRLQELFRLSDCGSLVTQVVSFGNFAQNDGCAAEELQAPIIMQDNTHVEENKLVK